MFAARHKTLAPPYELSALPQNAQSKHKMPVADELAGDDVWDGYSMVVNDDEHGNEIVRAPIEG
jgi:hypothetical protein